MVRRIAVKLTPKAAADRVGATRTLPNGEEVLVVSVTAAPDKGKANEALLRLLAKHWGCPVSCLKIVRGLTSRNKVIAVEFPLP